VNLARTFHVRNCSHAYAVVVLLAILPWFAVLFTSIAAVVLFMAARRPTERQPTLTEKPIDA
jgi:hypothetical protein